MSVINFGRFRPTHTHTGARSSGLPLGQLLILGNWRAIAVAMAFDRVSHDLSADGVAGGAMAEARRQRLRDRAARIGVSACAPGHARVVRA